MIRISRITAPRASLLAFVLLAVTMLVFGALASGEANSNMAAHAVEREAGPAPKASCAGGIR